ncbi:MAG: site-2 protease family protein [Ignavibacteriaceae bacterium]|nr:site-2 protease family protein [Ignavibacteriaceae bacterium]
MSEEFQTGAPESSKTNYWLPILLFLLTFATTTIAGKEWISGYSPRTELTDLVQGLPFSLSILFVLACHEFGHYFASMFHKVKTSLPYFLPFFSFQGMILNFGTLGALIRTREPIQTKKALFDIGIAGPIAGFIASLGVLIYGFLNVPDLDYLLRIHPDYFAPDYGKNSLMLLFGDNLLFSSLRWLIVPPDMFFPPMSEIYHYPYLCVGWFGLFVTSMNLIPVGQLDGGHIVYSMFGDKIHKTVSSISLILLVALGIIGIIENYMALNTSIGWIGWLFWAAVLNFILKRDHPPVYDSTELDLKRKIIGYIGILIFILSFTPVPFYIGGTI